MNKKSLYMLLGWLSLSGYAWLAWNGTKLSSCIPFRGICIFKAVTHLPCPSCGATRAIVLLLNGHISESLFLNPLGALLLIALIVIPVWLAADLLMKRESLHRWYVAAERVLRQNAWVSIPLVSLVIANWVWNILKNL